MITINSRRFDGSIRRSWHCELVEQRDSLLICVGEFDTEIRHPDLGRIAKGTISYEYFWLDRWYNIFRFHEPSGEFRNFYGNIVMPPRFDGAVIDYVDLDIDVLVQSGSDPVVLDVEDYEANANKFGYADTIRSNVDESLQELLEVFERRNMPGLPELFATSW